MKTILIFMLLSCAAFAAFPGPGRVPDWGSVTTYSRSMGLEEGTAELILHGSFKIESDGSSEGCLTADRVDAGLVNTTDMTITNLTADYVNATYVVINDFIALKDVSRDSIDTPPTGEVRVFKDDISKKVSFKDWSGRVFAFDYSSLEDIPFLFNTGTYTDYTYSGTYGTNWNASSTSIFNVNDLSNPSGSPYALTLQTKVSRLVDISSITPSGFTVEYGPYDTGNIKFGSIGNSGNVYTLSDGSAEIYDATQASATDFLDWTSVNSGAFVTWTASAINYGTASGERNGVYINYPYRGECEMIFTCSDYAGGDTILAGLYNAGISSTFGWNSMLAALGYKNGATSQYRYRDVSNNTANQVEGSPISGTVYYRIKVSNLSGDSATVSFWQSSSSHAIGDDSAWGAASYSTTGYGFSSATNWYVVVGGDGGTVSENCSNLMFWGYGFDATDPWTTGKMLNPVYATESQVNSAISHFKSDTGCTVYGPYVSFTSGSTGEIESINISY